MNSIKVHTLLTLSLFWFVGQAAGQTEYNDWIEEGPLHFRVWVDEPGWYRLTGEQLVNAGFSLANDPQNIRMFHRGKEMAIRVNDGGDGFFDTRDYIEFYGEQADGALDKELFVPGGFQLNPDEGMYDTHRSYFLTTSTRIRGKRVEEALAPTSGTDTISYHSTTRKLALFNQRIYHPGQYFPRQAPYSLATYSTEFKDAEGFVYFINSGNRYSLAHTTDTLIRSINLAGIDLSAPDNLVLRMRIAGQSYTPHILTVMAGPSATELSEVKRISFNSFSGVDDTVRLSKLLVNADSSLFLGWSLENTLGSSERSNLSRIGFSIVEMTYPQKNSFNNQPDTISTQGPVLLEYEDIPTSVQAYDVTDPYTVVPLGKVESKLSVNGNGTRKILVQEGVKTVPVEQFELASIDRLPEEGDINYVIISHPIFRTDKDYVQQYADYRSSPEGGSFSVYIADIENLYNQFSYGELSPAAVQRFIRYMQSRYDLEFVFIIGKGRSFLNGSNLSSHRVQPNVRALNPIPTFGFPGSDAGLVAPESNRFLEATVPLGRLSCTTPKEVQNYLEKVRVYESFEYDQLWKKNLMHLSGGLNEEEASNFFNYLQSFEEIAEDNFLGAEVKKTSRKTAQAVEVIDISDEVNNGLTLITFFGHSSANFSDIDIGKVTNPAFGYDNFGKYPMMYMNGCQAGLMFDKFNAESFGENWVNAADKGAVLFLGSSWLGYPQALREHTEDFYQTAFGDSSYIFRPIGQVLQETNRRSAQFASTFLKADIQHMNLQGDPAIRLFNQTSPDYAVLGESVQALGFTDQNLTAQSDSFLLQIPLANFGLFVDREIRVGVTRRFTDGSTRSYSAITLPEGIRYEDTVFLKIAQDPDELVRSIGLNTFTITVDSEFEVSETNEFNNSYDFELNLISGTPQILFPLQSSLVNDETPTLIIQDASPQANLQRFEVQVDTSFRFSSPVLTTFTEEAFQLIQKDLELPVPENGQVYYVRARYGQTSPDVDTSWTYSDFTYTSDPVSGFQQSEPGQFLRNRLVQVTPSGPGASLDFIRKQINVRAVATGGISPNPRNYSVAVEGTTLVSPGACNNGTINDRLLVVVFDGETGDLKRNLYSIDRNGDNISEDLNCGSGFPGAALSIESSIQNLAFNQLEEFIEPGDYALFVKLGRFNLFNLTTAQKNYLAGFGLNLNTLPSKIQREDAYIALGKLGGSEAELIEVIPEPLDGIDSRRLTIEGNLTINLDFKEGEQVTPPIGPARSYDRLVINAQEEDTSTEELTFNLFGQNLTGEETLLRKNLTEGSYSLQFINPANFPFLRLEANYLDTLNQTITNLEDWSVYYQPVQEGVLSYRGDARYYLQEFKLLEGDSAVLRFDFTNISSTAFEEPIVYRYTLRNTDIGRSVVVEDTLAPLSPGDSAVIELKVPTLGWVGTNSINLIVNPRIQPEQYYSNNLLEFSYRVVPDEGTPNVVILFDGRPIRNGDIVSPQPVITIRGTDDNPFLSLEDSTLFDLSLANCDSCPFNQIPDAQLALVRNTRSANSRQVNESVQAENGVVEVKYVPADTLGNGDYVLRVNFEDASGNKASSEPYEVRFQVINESTITNFYPYPNPFSDRVKFVFTLTGSALPTQMKIQIMTITGKVVREITQGELGPIYVGNNITEYAWDGRDEYGSLLGNGVYLYRVIMNKPGDMTRRETNGDNLFKKNVGKLYLIR